MCVWGGDFSMKARDSRYCLNKNGFLLRGGGGWWSVGSLSWVLSWDSHYDPVNFGSVGNFFFFLVSFVWDDNYEVYICIFNLLFVSFNFQLTDKHCDKICDMHVRHWVEATRDGSQGCYHLGRAIECCLKSLTEWL